MSDNQFIRMRPAISLCLAALAGCTYPDPDLRPASPRRAAFGEAVRKTEGKGEALMSIGRNTKAWVVEGRIVGQEPLFTNEEEADPIIMFQSPVGYWCTEPAIASDGKAIAWTARDMSRPGNPMQVLIGARIEDAPRVVAISETGSCRPSFSPDGGRLAWEKSSDTGSELWTTELATSKATFVTDGSSPAWSPNGAWIAFEFGDPPAIWKVHPDGTDRTRLTESREGHRPTWSPDSLWIAFGQFDSEGRADDVWAVRADGSRYLRVTWDPAPEWDPCWAPDGRIYFTTIRNGAQGIWAVAPENTELLK